MNNSTSGSPAARTIALLSAASSTVMARKNVTLQWLYSLAPADREFQEALTDKERQPKVTEMDRNQAVATKTRRAETNRQTTEKQRLKVASKASDMAFACFIELFAGADELDAALANLGTVAVRTTPLVKQHIKAYRVMWRTSHQYEMPVPNSSARTHNCSGCRTAWHGL